MDPRILVAVCFVLFFIIIFLLQAIMGSCEEQLIPGFWSVSDQFKEKANIDQLILYFDEGKGYRYNGFIVMVVENETLFNGTMSFRITPKGYFKANTFEFVTEKNIGTIPSKLTMTLCPCTGRMELKCLNDKKIYAELFKDNQMSAKTILKISDSGDDVDATDTVDAGGDEIRIDAESLVV